MIKKSETKAYCSLSNFHSRQISNTTATNNLENSDSDLKNYDDFRINNLFTPNGINNANNETPQKFMKLTKCQKPLEPPNSDKIIIPNINFEKFKLKKSQNVFFLLIIL